MEQNWIDIALKVALADAEQAELIIGECTAYGIYIEDYSRLEEETLEIAHIDLIDKDLLRKERDCVVIHLYIAENENPQECATLLGERLKCAGIGFSQTQSSIKQEDWANNWKQYFHQHKFGEKLLICPSWEEAKNTEGRAVLYLEPGMAFGTGTHPTTCLCMEVMEPFINSQTRLLDVGCGSGILALSAMLLGAQSAIGVDIDEKAVKTALENAERNDYSAPQVTFLQGDLTEKISGSFNLIVANIVADVIVLLCKDITRFMEADAHLVVSGIIKESEAQVREAFETARLAVLERYEKEGWLAFVLTKK
ncbi:MAG: 50S ribosomal protein L11 methyltransferase [Clostridia bacterium]|nr:50S ribosomal protein L11 methyltransferase [Clostridia bacterium]